MVVIGIVGIIMTFSTVNLVSLRNKASTNSMVTQLVADLKQQQMKAMIGDSSAPDCYGVRFTNNSYTLFRDVNCSGTTSDNFTPVIESDINFTISPSDIIFKKGCGELVISSTTAPCGEITAPTPTPLELKISNTAESKTLKFNQFGVITEVKN